MKTFVCADRTVFVLDTTMWYSVVLAQMKIAIARTLFTGIVGGTVCVRYTASRNWSVEANVLKTSICGALILIGAF